MRSIEERFVQRSPVVRFIQWVVASPKRTGYTILADWVLCSAAYSIVESKGPISGLWWGVVTGSTVGYGDFYPASTAGRGIGAFLIISMWGLVIAAGAHFTAGQFPDPNVFTDEEQQQVLADLAEVRRLATEMHEDIAKMSAAVAEMAAHNRRETTRLADEEKR